jgi:phosphohistidine phosphatase
MGELLKDKELLPQLVLCSTAVRARQTAELLVKSSGFGGQMQLLELFYLAEPPVYLTELRHVADEVERVLVIGHNPGLEGVVQMLSRQIVSLPTGAIAHFSLPIVRWDELTTSTEGELVEVLLPPEAKEPEKPKEKEKKGKQKKDKDKSKKGKKK